MRSERTVGFGASLLRRGQVLIAAFVVVGVILTGALVVSDPSAAWAKEYPSWSDVVNARKDEKQTKAKVKEIRDLLVALQADVERTAAVAEKEGAEYQEAETAYFEAALKAQELQDQADAAAESAEESELLAGQLAAQLARTGNNDLTLSLLLNGENADDLLSMLGQAGKVSEQANGIYTRALQDRNSAQALTDQANVAKAILEELKLKALEAFAEAKKAAEDAAVAFEASQAHKEELEAQLAALTTDRKKTENDFLAGVRAANAAAAKAGLGAGEISASGWAKPVNGSISSGFGYRLHPIYEYSRFHAGTDIASSCGSRIYAASSGKVIYAGWYGSYGNFVLIEHGNGIQTGYAHIVNGGILVKNGQSVGVGTQIAKVGSTGASTGCHLHFEVRKNGVATDSVPFMRKQGITIR